jgi:glucose/arabinose dehydrogenase
LIAAERRIMTATFQTPRARAAWLFLLVLVAAPGLAEAQLRSQLVASGLTHPLEFVQDPSDPATRYIVQQDGRIRALRNGVLSDFLNLSTQISTGGERGLLGLAFPSDYAVSGRFYACFTSPLGDLVVSRFRRSGNPLVADPASRFDLQWSTAERFIRHRSADNHNGGHLEFGADGYLYVAVGDGGGSGDTANNAQNLSSLLGKILRIDVGVSDADPNGFVIPPGNPFAGTSAPEIWSLGLRNPWKFTFDALTGAMFIADVGQGAWEEVNFEPAGAGGRNYGWRNREGAHDFNPSVAPVVLPLREPIHEYDHGIGRSISGGFVYRGSALGPSFRGRYFFADFITARVWSMAVDQAGGQASDLREHTSELGAIGNISAFGEDAAGELYLVSWSRGEILRITSGGPVVAFDGVIGSGAGLEVSGWAIDRRASTGSGMDAVHVYVYPSSGEPPVFMGARVPPFTNRPDIAGLFGSQFLASGFRIFSTQWVSSGPATVVAYARSSVTGLFEAVASQAVTIPPRRNRVGWIDVYPSGAVIQPITIAGWAIDHGVATAPPSFGTGVGPVFVDLFSATGAFVQSVQATYGFARPDVAGIFGARFVNSGFSARVMDLRPGSYFAHIRYWMIAASDWDVTMGSSFTVNPGPMLTIDAPAAGSTGSTSFLVGGWAIDLRSSTGTGVDAIHVWAYPTSGAAPIFVGAPAYGSARPDVAAAFGSSRFTNVGYNQIVGPVAPGTYDVVVWARSTVTGTFAINRVVRVTVP